MAKVGEEIEWDSLNGKEKGVVIGTYTTYVVKTKLSKIIHINDKA